MRHVFYVDLDQKWLRQLRTYVFEIPNFRYLISGMAIPALLAERPLYKNQIMIIKLILKTLIQKHHNKQFHDVSSDTQWPSF